MKTKYENEKDYGVWGFKERRLSDICSSHLGLATVVTQQPATGWHLIQSCGLGVKFLRGAGGKCKMVYANRHTSLSFRCPVH